MAFSRRTKFSATVLCSSLLALSACDAPIDFDLRGNGANASSASRQETTDRPQADDRGVISYPNYQVAIANEGDTINDVAARVGLSAEALSRYNGIAMGTTLRQGEVVALPTRVAEPSLATGAITSGPITPAGNTDISSIAGDAIKRAGDQPAASTTTKPTKPTGKEPIRHKVERGETAYSISRVYNVSVRSLADWNGLGTDLNVREGQYLLIPVAAEAPPKSTAPTTTAPGQGSVAPEPPSAAKPLPDEKTTKVEKPPSPNLASDKTTSSDTAKLLMPVTGKITRPYVKDKNDGIDISAAAGTPVKAAAAGTVAAITRDTNQVPILVLRHADNILTVYAGVDNLTVKKGDKVKRGQVIAKIRAGSPSFLHFEVRKGLDSVDPVPMLN
ncbi:MAG: peptidoglycan DD-metalloendopeptidase family protein [Paracoccaceae bacterium]